MHKTYAGAISLFNDFLRDDYLKNQFQFFVQQLIEILYFRTIRQIKTICFSNKCFLKQTVGWFYTTGPNIIVFQQGVAELPDNMPGPNNFRLAAVMMRIGLAGPGLTRVSPHVCPSSKIVKSLYHMMKSGMRIKF